MIMNPQDIHNMMDPLSIPIDSGSTFNSFNLESLLMNMVPCDGMCAYSNGGSLDYHKIGSGNKFPANSAYFNPDLLANILSLSSFLQFYRVTMDSQQSNYLTAHISAHEIHYFVKCGIGLYCLDPSVPAQYIDEAPPPVSTDTSNVISDNTNNHPVSVYSFFSTVASNKEFFSCLEIEGADTARILQSRLDWPSN